MICIYFELFSKFPETRDRKNVVHTQPFWEFTLVNQKPDLPFSSNFFWKISTVTNILPQSINNRRAEVYKEQKAKNLATTPPCKVVRKCQCEISFPGKNGHIKFTVPQ